MNSSPNEFTQLIKSAKSAEPVPNPVPETQELSSEPVPNPVPETQELSSDTSVKESPNNEGTAISPPVSDPSNPETNPEIVAISRDDTQTNPEIVAISRDDSPEIDNSMENSGDASPEIESMRQHPIPPPSEPRQYRAIGLVYGHYRASEEQFTKGMLVTPDRTEIDAVLLGRVMSLVKNHIDLEENHLWVVYPRTRQNNGELHLQIVGIWEPEQLGPNNQASEDSAPSEEVTPDTASQEDAKGVEESEYPPVTDGYFSIRGEGVYQSNDDEGYIIIKIKQHPRKPSDETKFFKLKLKGTLNGKAVGHFWDLHLKREGQNLFIEQGQDLGLVGPTKRKDLMKKREGRRFGGRKPSGRSKSFQRPAKKPFNSSASARPVSVPKPKPTIKKRPKPTEQE